MSNKRKILAAAFSALFILGAAAGCTTVEKHPTEPGADEGWQGNWTKPGISDVPDVTVHDCGHKCYVCEKCLSDCEDEKCADKCFEKRDRQEYVFNGTDGLVEKRGGVTVNPDGYLGGINANASAEITYCIYAESDVTACLGLEISQMHYSCSVTAMTPVYINDEQFFSRGSLEAGSTPWYNFYNVWLGCVTLHEGKNTVKITGKADAYNIKALHILSDAALELVPAKEEHICKHKNEQGKCTDYTCNDNACMDKDETGWKKLEIDPADEKVLKYGTSNGNEMSLWNGAEKCIGYIANGSITGITDQTVVFAFNASEASYVRISLNTGTMLTAETPWDDMWTFTFNGVTVVPGAITKAAKNPDWSNYQENSVIYVKAEKGVNMFCMVHKATNAGDNINNIILSYEKGELTVAQAVKPGTSVNVSGVTLEAEGGKTSVHIGGTLRLNVVITPSYALDKSVAFSSSDESIATVDGNGLVTGVSAGEVTVTVTTTDGGFTAQLGLTVTVPVSEITLATASGSSELTEGDTTQLIATVLPDNANDKTVAYSSSNTDVLTVDASGLVTAVYVGVATVTAAANDGSGIIGTIEITVNALPDRVAVSGVTLVAENGATSVEKGGTLQLTATVEPENATTKNVSFLSSDDSVATVDANGLVTGVEGGEVVITVTTLDESKTATLSLTVTVAATAVNVSAVDGKATGIILAGGTIDLACTVSPANATVKSVEWKAENASGEAVENAITVNADGTVTFVPPVSGDYTVTATATDGSGVSDTYTVNVFDNKAEADGTYAKIGKGSAFYNVNERCIGNVAKKDKITFTVNSASAQSVMLEIEVAAVGTGKATDYFTVKVGDEKCSPRSNKIKFTGETGWTNKGLVAYKKVDLPEGKTDIVITIAKKQTNIFGITVYGDGISFEKEERVTGDDRFFEGETAARGSGSLGGITVNTGDAGAKSGTSLGNINGNIGATLTYAVKAEEKCSAGLYANLAFGSATVTNIFGVTVNGKEVVIPNGFIQNGANWTTYNEFFFANVELDAGMNIVVLTVTGMCGNFDYITLKSATNITAASVVTEINVAPPQKELLNIGDELDLSVTAVGPEGYKLLYTSSDTSVASADAAGKITALSVGKAVITVKADDEYGLEKHINIFVSSAVGVEYEAENVAAEDRPNTSIESDGKHLGGLNVEGAKVIFKVGSASGGKALLRIHTSVVVGNKLSIDRYYSVKVNGAYVDLSGGQFAFNGITPNWNVDNGFFTVEIELEAGENNTVELIPTGTDVQTNLDKIVVYQ